MNRWFVIGIGWGVFLGLMSVVWVGQTPAQPALKMPSQMQAVSIKQLHHVLMQEIGGRVDTRDITLNLQVLFPKKPIQVPSGRLKLEVAKDRFGNITGRRAFRVHVKVDSRPIKTVSVVAAITAQADVVTPVRWIKFRQVLHPKDLVKTRVNLRTLTQDVVLDMEDVVGKQATRSLPPHQPLRRAYVTVPPLVRKGDRVMIEVKRGGLFVQTLGVAKASGQSGEIIPVTNQSSGREVLATVLSTGVVEVRF